MSNEISMLPSYLDQIIEENFCFRVADVERALKLRFPIAICETGHLGASCNFPEKNGEMNEDVLRPAEESVYCGQS